MTKCFQDHECDTQVLYKNTKPVSECNSYVVDNNGTKTKITEVPILTCECIWRTYQKEAEDIVAPGGTLIADPQARNRAINAAYAKLWLSDNRFQWAGLAAFASKQVGCGLLHATEAIQKIQAEHDAITNMQKNSKQSFGIPGVISISTASPQDSAAFQQAVKNNPVPSIDVWKDGQQSVMQQQYQYICNMLALGNTTLFLDVYPLHEFYKKRGLNELQQCLPVRYKIVGNSQFPVLWPIGNKLIFGRNYPEILQAFQAIDSGNIADSVKYLAMHEQKTILQPAMYNDSKMVELLRGNQMSYVTGIPSGVAEALQLTLASQCSAVNDGRTINFSNNPVANLSDFNQRMPFVLKAAAQFNDLLHNADRSLIQMSLEEIAAGGGVK